MKILLVHEYYRQPGGEDRVFDAESALLEEYGHEVVRYTERNERIDGMPRVPLALGALWSRRSSGRLRSLVEEERPDVVHFHNTFPLVSPSAYWAAKAAGVPVVQTLHNYRLVCPAAAFYRDGHLCEECMGRAVPWPGVVHACYQGSRAATGVTAAMLTLHRAVGTWKRKVDRYIALTEFARRKMVEGGLPEEKIGVKPNFVHPAPEPGGGGGGYAAFVGRLSPEKGVRTLLGAWEGMDEPVPLRIAGDGPLAGPVRRAAERDRRIEWLGHQPLERAQGLIGEAACLIVPSITYETFGRTIVEALATGTPVVASRLGAMAELVDHERTGLLFEAGDPAALAAAVVRLVNDESGTRRMREEARREYERRYTAERSHAILMETYAAARREAEGR